MYPVWSVVIFAIIFFALALVAIFWILKITYHSVAFRPSKAAVDDTPDGWEEVSVAGRMHGWMLNAFPGRPYVLFYHGNSGNINYYTAITNLCSVYEFNMLVFDYAGYGKSEGFPSVKQILQDGLDSYDWLIEKVAPYGVEASEVILLGYSLGGAVATYVAVNRESVSKLWLMNTFSSLDKFFPSSVQTLAAKLFETFPTGERLKEYAAKGGRTVVMMSDKDGFIPLSHAETLVGNSGGLPLLIQGTHTSPRVPPTTMLSALEYFGYSSEPNFNLI